MAMVGWATGGQHLPPTQVNLFVVIFVRFMLGLLIDCCVPWAEMTGWDRPGENGES